MIRTKAYITREITRLSKRKRKLKEELDMMNRLGKQTPDPLFISSKDVIKREILKLEGKIEFALFVANTSEKDLPKIKSKKKVKTSKPQSK